MGSEPGVCFLRLRDPGNVLRCGHLRLYRLTHGMEPATVGELHFARSFNGRWGDSLSTQVSIAVEIYGFLHQDQGGHSFPLIAQA